MKTKSKVLWSFEIIGAFLLLVGILLSFNGAAMLDIPFIRMDLVPFAVGFIGVLFIIGAGVEIWYEKRKTTEQIIEEKDERMIAIHQRAKSRGFDFFAVLFPASMLILALFGYMNKVAFFVLAGIYLACQCYYYYLLIKYKKEM